ncbi:IclR family transcriptional regulator [Variovorax sp. KK3]|uniref:IclR family transcriptional regulator n=1 Tax=Variovorax sp. KK3 TaxID=1855728 RepID=UPI00097C639D|nr:helix-turn-helix domain-containing protein [Variovorax sp. KK3]
MKDNRSVQRCLALLRAFKTQPRQTLAELSKGVELPHSTVLRFLHTLEREGYVRIEGGLWSLGPQMLDLGFTALRSMGISESVQDTLQRLADACKGTVNIGERHDDEVLVLARVSSVGEHMKMFVVNLRVGSHLPKESALYRAVDLPADQWCVAQYPELRHVTIAMPMVLNASRVLSLGLSVDSEEYPMERVETELVALLRKERSQIEQLMMLNA